MALDRRPIDWSAIWNVAQHRSCATAEEARRVGAARPGAGQAGRSRKDNNFVKAGGDPEGRHLLPDPFRTLQAAEQLVAEGFTVAPYSQCRSASGQTA